jgi:hypothetical protein
VYLNALAMEENGLAGSFGLRLGVGRTAKVGVRPQKCKGLTPVSLGVGKLPRGVVPAATVMITEIDKEDVGVNVSDARGTGKLWPVCLVDPERMHGIRGCRCGAAEKLVGNGVDPGPGKFSAVVDVVARSGDLALNGAKNRPCPIWSVLQADAELLEALLYCGRRRARGHWDRGGELA